MADKIYIGHNKQLFINSGTAVREEFKAGTFEIYQCRDPKMWKNGSDQYIAELKNKSFIQVARMLGYRTWFKYFSFKNRIFAVFSFLCKNNIYLYTRFS